jgi:triosephosphate isomerase (TIM)
MSQYLEQTIRSIVTDCVERYIAGQGSDPNLRKPLVVGNWKMNLSLDAALQYVRDFESFRENVDAVVCPPFPFLFPMHRLAASMNKPLSFGAQNMHWKESGAYTGEVSASMLRQVGCSYVIVGHSERRMAGETDEQIHQKVIAALEGDLTPILCVGESAVERVSRRTTQVIRRQLTAALEGVKDLAKVVIAYEPVWAIGTGQPATAAYAQTVHSDIRGIIRRMSPESADKVRLLYGGSVNAENASEYSAQPDIDGVLVGSASLSAAEFQAIIQSFGMKVGAQ